MYFNRHEKTLLGLSTIMNLEGVWRLWTENSESVAYVCGKSTSHSVLLAVYIYGLMKKLLDGDMMTGCGVVDGLHPANIFVQF
jgi:hypothetical protein